MSLGGKVAIVTGAARGIGAATTALIIERGAKVIACDRDEGALESLVGRLHGSNIVPVVADVSEEQSNDLIVRTALKHFGRLDVAFLNAGIAGDIAATHEYSIEVFERVMRVNAFSVFFGLKHALTAMMAGGGGSIVCTSSVQGMQASGYTIAYTAAKHAVMGMVRTAALEYARHRIRVNAVNPGVTDTDMMDHVHGTIAPNDLASIRAGFESAIPMGRYGTADEVARLMAFLASDESSYITGMPHTIAGGMGVPWVPPMQVPVS